MQPQSRRKSAQSLVHRECETCGKTFFTKASEVKRDRGRFCSLPCFHETVKNTPDRFWAKVKKSDDPDGCWIWQGTIMKKYGHGQVEWRGRSVLVHRLAWELTNGPIPEGMLVCHDCPAGDNPSCVNPSHLWLGTKAQNNADMAAKGRARGKPPAILTVDQVAQIKRRLIDGETVASVARAYGVSYEAISGIKHRRNWRHVEAA